MKSRTELLSLVPQHKSDEKNIASLESIGFPGLNPILPELLEWIQDINWPVARPICRLLGTAGKEIVPEIRKVLHSGDHEWVWFVTTSLLRTLRSDLQTELVPDLLWYIHQKPDQEYLDIVGDYLSDFLISRNGKAEDLSSDYFRSGFGDVLVEMSFLRTEDGGKSRPVISGYRPQFFYNNHDWDANHEYVGVECVNPGETVLAKLNFLSPDEHLGMLKVGSHFLIREGQKIVAYGHVTEILHLEDSAIKAAIGATRKGK